MEQKKEQKKKKRSRLFVWFRRLFFGPGRELSFLEEEQVQSPMRSIVSRFFHNRIAMTGVVIFAACLLLVLIGPLFLPLDLSYSDSTQQNVPPSMGLAEVPAEMKNGKIAGISAGTTYGLGCDTNGGGLHLGIYQDHGNHRPG